jgi:hypothetical protein
LKDLALSKEKERQLMTLSPAIVVEAKDFGFDDIEGSLTGGCSLREEVLADGMIVVFLGGGRGCFATGDRLGL